MKKTKVLHIVPNMQAGGLETFIMNVMRNIDRSKVQFDFLVHYKEPKFYDNEIESLGGKIYRFTLRDDNNLIKYIKELNAFFKQHKEYKIVHCHMPSIAFIVFIVAKHNGVKTRIIHSHSTSTEKTIKGYTKNLLSKLAKYFSTDNLACSTSAGEYLFKNKEFKIIPNGIDFEKFKFDNNKRNKIREELNISPNTIVIGHVGRLEKVKNHDKLIDIFNEYQKEQKNSKLIIVGSGKEEEIIKNKCKKLEIENKVIILSNRKDTDYLYSAFDIFLFPSLFEGLGIVLIEAQISGLYCYTTKDKVPKESCISNRIKYIKLESIWHNQLIDNNTYDRNAIKFNKNKNNYDIKKVSKVLEEFYLEKN